MKYLIFLIFLSGCATGGDYWSDKAHIEGFRHERENVMFKREECENYLGEIGVEMKLPLDKIKAVCKEKNPMPKVPNECQMGFYEQEK